jgi:hypothetical protein
MENRSVVFLFHYLIIVHPQDFWRLATLLLARYRNITRLFKQNIVEYAKFVSEIFGQNTSPVVE